MKKTKTTRITVRLEPRLLEVIRRINIDSDDLAYQTGEPRVSLAHTIRSLIGHGIHRKQSGCNCNANRKTTGDVT